MNTNKCSKDNEYEKQGSAIIDIASRIIFNLSKLKYFFRFRSSQKMSQFPTSQRKIKTNIYWDNRSYFYQAMYHKVPRMEYLNNVLFSSGTKKVMELGCGTGDNLKMLASHFPQIEFSGIDSSEKMLDIAQKNLKGFQNIKMICADLEKTKSLSFESQDLIFSRHTLQHLSPAGLKHLFEYLFDHITSQIYLQEVHVRGYSNGAIINYPGFPHGMFYNHDYLFELNKYCKIEYAKYYKGYILHSFAKHNS